MNKLFEKIEDVTDEFEETTEEMFKFINDVGFMTGSYLWNVHSENSDIDILIYPNSEINFNDTIIYHNGIYYENLNIPHYFQEGFRSCYVLYDSKIYNLLFMETEEIYNKWIKATMRMNKNIDTIEGFRDSIKDKKHRIELFEKYKEEK